ncbi:uncharacterized protein [Rutidosis leptorrhynchoides]|uniref:uncharacterized protein n=1 Tax=Rutidosis leptorrhynchoides TaxID=125765 RepID=UPI003A99C39F
MGSFNFQGEMEWDFGLYNVLEEYDTIQVLILKHLLRNTVFELDKEDSILWVHSVDNLYTVAEGVRVILGTNLDVDFDWVKVVWKYVASKIAIFHWLAIQGGVPVRKVLRFRHCLRDGDDDKCSRCLVFVESVEHLLLHCSWASNVWSALLRWWNVS